MNRSVNRWLWVAILVSLLWLAGAVSAEESKGVTNPFDGRDDLVPKGKTLFNVHCSHCHGPNAVQGERKRDLRRLSKRYKERMPTVFYTTATTGRASKGMPPWKGVLKDEELWTIFTFLKTVQKK
ncbi:c-type cytochrome [Candidatus Entotheonella palauensis]|nr:c-type cytochrome [Candidatus Entotheonella palauensis]